MDNQQARGVKWVMAGLIAAAGLFVLLFLWLLVYLEVLPSPSELLEYHFSFLQPWWLLLLLLLPALWFFSYRSLAGLGGPRRMLALAFRSLVLVLIVLSLAEFQLVRKSDRLTTIFLLDLSRSIPEDVRRDMVTYVNEAIKKHREHRDRAGVIVFGRTAGIEIPPFDDDIQVAARPETPVDQNYTDLSAAIKLAMASFPEDAAKRMVVITDGNQNRGDAMQQAKAAIDAGVGIDVLPVRYDYPNEVMVEKVAIPADVRKGQPIDLRVVLNNTSNKKVPGRLILTQTIDGRTEVMNQDPAAQRVVLDPGKNVIPFRHVIEHPNFYRFEATFIPEDAADDPIRQNNQATALTHVEGNARVLLIENRDKENRGNFDHLVEVLRNENLEVTVRLPDDAFTNLAELQAYDTVILADVPRFQMGESQINDLAKNTHDTGCGLIMLGGANSFGAGSWANSPLEEAMPVNFEIKSDKVVPKGALVMIMHASEMANGNHWQKQIGKAALNALGSLDYCGVLHWNGNDRWLWTPGMQVVGPNREKMIARINKMWPGDMPFFDPGMVKARQALAGLPDSAVKHVIVISDGDPTPPRASTLNSFRQLKITVTTVAVGTHGLVDQQTMRRIARVTGGKYYMVKNPKALPKIYQKEASVVAKPLIYENTGTPFAPQITFPSELVRGIDSLPPITGYVMTEVKQNPLVEVSLVAPLPQKATAKNRTILAQWQYGLGKSVAFTTDAGHRWANQWTAWENYSKLFSQIVRYSMRPSGDTGKYTMAKEIEDGKVKLIVTALDEEDQFVNDLAMQTMVIRPDGESMPVRMEQTAPGRYETSFEAEQAGSYVIATSPGPNRTPIRTGINVPYSAEFRDRQTNEALLENLAQLSVEGVDGKMIEVPPAEENVLEGLLAVNPFRHDLPQATSSQDGWHWLLLAAAVLFLVDVFNRRVAVSLAWLVPLAERVWARIRGREVQPQEDEYMERLRSRKAELADRIEKQRAATRFEVEQEADEFAGAVDEVSGPAPPPSRGEAGGVSPAPEPEEESYTDRLLKAKKKVWEDRDKRPDE